MTYRTELLKYLREPLEPSSSVIKLLKETADKFAIYGNAKRAREIANQISELGGVRQIDTPIRRNGKYLKTEFEREENVEISAQYQISRLIKKGEFVNNVLNMDGRFFSLDDPFILPSLVRKRYFR